jgi:hypothetical protein
MHVSSRRTHGPHRAWRIARINEAYRHPRKHRMQRFPFFRTFNSSIDCRR